MVQQIRHHDEPPTRRRVVPRVPPDHKDAELVGRLLAGDELAFRGLIREHRGGMLRVARGYLPTTTAAEEAVQETWLAILDALPRFQGRSSLKTWIYRILANRARSRARREGRTVPVSALGGLDDEGRPAVDVDRFTTAGMWARSPSEFGGPPDARADRAEIMDQVYRALEDLPARQRVVITLRDVEGLSGEEVCSVLAISPTNQRVLLHRARTKVRAAMGDFLAGAV